MSALVVLLGLLVLAYIGSFLVGGRALRGAGLPSGTEYVALGILLGPEALGMVERSTLDLFEPVAYAALGWLGFLVGIDYGVVGARRVPFARIAFGCTAALAGASLTAGVVLLVLGHVSPLHGTDAVLVACGIGAATAETTRDALVWAAERHGARGPLWEVLDDIAAADGLVPLLATGALFVVVPPAHAVWSIPLAGWAFATLATGAILAAIVVVLLAGELSADEGWGVVLGASLLAIGTATRLGLSVLAVMFVFGLTISMVSKHSETLRKMVAPTERSVLLPTLLLAGARVAFHVPRYVALVVTVAIVLRIAVKFAAGQALRVFPEARRGSSLLGFALLSSGTTTMAVGLAFALRFPGAVGDIVLLSAAVATIAGEFVGPAALRRTLRDAGEIDGAPQSEAPSAAAGP